MIGQKGNSVTNIYGVCYVMCFLLCYQAQVNDLEEQLRDSDKRASQLQMKNVNLESKLSEMKVFIAVDLNPFILAVIVS